MPSLTGTQIGRLIYNLTLAVVLILQLCVDFEDGRGDYSGRSGLFGPGSFLAFFVTYLDVRATSWSTEALLNTRTYKISPSTESLQNVKNVGIQALTVIGYLAAAFTSVWTFRDWVMTQYTLTLMAFLTLFERSAFRYSYEFLILAILPPLYPDQVKEVLIERTIVGCCIFGFFWCRLTLIPDPEVYTMPAPLKAVLVVGARAYWLRNMNWNIKWRPPIPKTTYHITELDQIFPLALSIVGVIFHRRDVLYRFYKWIWPKRSVRVHREWFTSAAPQATSEEK